MGSIMSIARKLEQKIFYLRYKQLLEHSNNQSKHSSTFWDEKTPFSDAHWLSG
jgi:hypothetical protein